MKAKASAVQQKASLLGKGLVGICSFLFQGKMLALALTYSTPPALSSKSKLFPNNVHVVEIATQE